VVEEDESIAEAVPDDSAALVTEAASDAISVCALASETIAASSSNLSIMFGVVL
jgi:hypothetical protein